jgi:hypothetical protein
MLLSQTNSSMYKYKSVKNYFSIFMFLLLIPYILILPTDVNREIFMYKRIFESVFLLLYRESNFWYG